MTQNDEYEIVRAGPADADAMVAVAMRAFDDNPMQKALFPKERAHLTPASDITAWRVEKLAERIRKAVYFKAVEKSTGKLVGYAAWWRPGTFSLNKNIQDVQNAHSTDDPGFPAAMDVEFNKRFLARLDVVRKEIWGDDSNFWYLGGIGVDPDHQRKGLAKMLLQFGIERSDEENVPIYLEGTPSGMVVYERLGFEKIRESSMPGEEYVDAHCIRRPQQKR